MVQGCGTVAVDARCRKWCVLLCCAAAAAPGVLAGNSSVMAQQLAEAQREAEGLRQVC
jgi:hypothetical protein